MARPRPSRQRPRRTLHLEVLESRCQPSTLTPASDVPDVLSQALDLTPALIAGHVRVASDIGDNALGGADVDWYRLEFAEPTSIALTLAGTGVISLYNDDLFSPDPTVQILHRRLLEQLSSDGNNLAVRSRSLAAGTYFIAVSGAGNQWFHPELADSGVTGQTGAYQLDVSTGTLSFAQPALLATDIPADGVFTQSPRAVHLTFSGDPAFVDAFVVQMLDGAPADFPPLELVYFSPETSEIQIVFAQALAPGDYQIWAFGGDNFDFLFEPIAFTVAAVEGGAEANDSVGTAHDLGTVSNGLLQVSGAIGDNPFYVFTGAEPGPGADLDFYRFTLEKSSNLIAEAFAHRIGSSLDVGLTLFQLIDGQPVLVAGNHNSLNDVVAGDASRPLREDAVLFLKLEAGEYFLVVSADENALDPYQGEAPGPDWYDPLVNNSAWRGQTTGNYVLNLVAAPADQTPPQVTHVSIHGGAELSQPPATFTVQFSEPVNLPQLVNSVYGPEHGAIFAVYVENANGDRWYPRLADYDADTALANFVMLDRLPAGSYELHLSGAQGLTDLFGNPLPETVVAFSVLNDTGVPTTIVDPNDSFEQPTELGVLFPRELEQGIVVVRDFNGQPVGDSADWYRFTVTQHGEYFFQLAGDGQMVAGPLLLFNSVGDLLPLTPNGGFDRASLEPGTYVLMISWDSEAVSDAVYQLTITLGFGSENPTPLTQGPAPAFRLQLLTSTPPTPPATPIVRLPDGGANVVPATLLTATPPALPSTGTRSLAAGPLGGASGGNGESTATALRLDLSAFSFASNKDGLLLTEPEESPEADTDGDSALRMEQFWRRIVDLLFQSIKPFNIEANPGDYRPESRSGSANDAKATAASKVLPNSPSKKGTGPLLRHGIPAFRIGPERSCPLFQRAANVAADADTAPISVEALRPGTETAPPGMEPVAGQQPSWAGACLALTGLFGVRDRSRRKQARPTADYI